MICISAWNNRLLPYNQMQIERYYVFGITWALFESWKGLLDSVVASRMSLSLLTAPVEDSDCNRRTCMGISRSPIFKSTRSVKSCLWSEAKTGPRCFLILCNCKGRLASTSMFVVLSDVGQMSDAKYELTRSMIFGLSSSRFSPFFQRVSFFWKH